MLQRAGDQLLPQAHELHAQAPGVFPTHLQRVRHLLHLALRVVSLALQALALRGEGRHLSTQLCRLSVREAGRGGGRQFWEGRRWAASAGQRRICCMHFLPPLLDPSGAALAVHALGRLPCLTFLSMLERSSVARASRRVQSARSAAMVPFASAAAASRAASCSTSAAFSAARASRSAVSASQRAACCAASVCTAARLACAAASSAPVAASCASFSLTSLFSCARTLASMDS